MRRVLAVIAAILLIFAAVLVRSRLDARQAGGDGNAGQVSGTLVCATELKTVCEQLDRDNPTLDVRIEDAGETARKLTDAAFNQSTAKIDAWLIVQPFPDMVADTRQRAGLQAVGAAPSGVLARSPLVMAVWTAPDNDRAAALRSSCNGEITWVCVGDVAGRPWTEAGGQSRWDRVKPGLPSPGTSATGLLTTAQATAKRLGRPTFASNDIRDDSAYRAWLGQLKGSMTNLGTTGETPLERIISQSGPAEFDLAGSVEALAGPVLANSRDKDRMAIIYPSPVVTMDVVLVPMAGSSTGGRVKRLLETSAAATALAQHGWRVNDQPTANGVRADLKLPDSNGLSSAGVLVALQQVWAEV